MASDPTIPSIVPNIGNSARYQAFAPQIDSRPLDRYNEGLQKAAQDALSLAQAISIQQQQAESKEAFNKFDVEINKFTQENFFSKQNKDLVRSYQPTLDALYPMAKKYADTLSGAARELFISSANERMRQMANSMNTQYMRGLQAWNNTESQARIENLINDAVADIEDWQNPKGNFQISLNAAKAEIGENLIYNGIPKNSEEYENTFRNTLSKFHSGALDGFISNDDVRQGKSYLAQYRNEMNAEDVQKYEDKLKRLQDAINARYAAQMAAKRAEANRLKGMSYDEQFVLAQQEYAQNRTNISNSNLTEEQKAAKLQELSRNFRTTIDTIKQAKEQSKLNDLSYKNAVRASYMNDIHSFFVNSPSATAVKLEDVFQDAHTISEINDLGLRDELQWFTDNRGQRKVPTTSDWETYNDMTRHPERYINMAQPELENLMANFTESMVREATDAIEKASSGKSDAVKEIIDGAVEELVPDNKALQGKFRSMVYARANDILRLKGGIATEKEKAEAISDAVITLSSISLQEGFYFNQNEVAEFLEDPGQGSFRVMGQYTDTYGMTTTYNMPAMWVFSPQGLAALQQVYEKANKETQSLGDANFILAALDHIYDEQQDQQNKENLGQNK